MNAQEKLELWSRFAAGASSSLVGALLGLLGYVFGHQLVEVLKIPSKIKTSALTPGEAVWDILQYWAVMMVCIYAFGKLVVGL